MIKSSALRRKNIGGTAMENGQQMGVDSSAVYHYLWHCLYDCISRFY